jgi:hypothetical protein
VRRRRVGRRVAGQMALVDQNRGVLDGDEGRRCFVDCGEAGHVYTRPGPLVWGVGLGGTLLKPAWPSCAAPLHMYYAISRYLCRGRSGRLR